MRFSDRFRLFVSRVSWEFNWSFQKKKSFREFNWSFQIIFWSFQIISDRFRLFLIVSEIFGGHLALRNRWNRVQILLKTFQISGACGGLNEKISFMQYYSLRILFIVPMVVANKVDGVPPYRPIWQQGIREGGENATISPDEGFRGEITKTKQRNPLWDSKKWKNIFRTAYSPQKLHKSDENMNKTTKN